MWAPTAAIVCPFSATIAFAENAILNGAHIVTACAVTGIEVAGNRTMAVETTLGRIATDFVVNAAGVHSGEVARMAGDESVTITPRRGEYVLFDHSVSDLVHSVVFPTPSKVSKGILVSPTVHGNVFIGPNASDVANLDDHETTRGGFAEIISGAQRMVPKLPLANAITEFAGIRAVAGHDFVIGLSPVVRGLVHAAGIQSPGLTSAPAIAETVVEFLGEAGLKLSPNAAFLPINPVRPKFAELERERTGEADRGEPALWPDHLPLRVDHRRRNRGGDPRPVRRQDDGRRQAARARRHGQVPGRVLRTAGDRDPGPRTGNTGDGRAQG